MDDVAAVRIATPFIGRDAELERLRELLGSTVAGSSAAVLLAGDAGVGKTSLAAEFGRYARESGAIVLTGRNVDLGSGGLPYLPFSEALAQVLREGRDATAERAVAARDVVLQIAQMRPSLARLVGRDEALAAHPPVDADLDRLALFEAVNETLGRISTTVAPVVVIMEDLHWAEQSTRDLLRFLLTRIGNDPLMFVATYRADDLHRRHPVRSLLAELVRLPAVELMELQPFDDAELAAFLDAVQGGSVPASVVRRIGERSAGNAYFAEELLSARAGDAAGSGGDRLPSALADVLIERLERLKPSTQQLVRAASVIGAFRIEDGLLRAAAAEGAALSAADADDALRDAVAHQVLVADNGDRFGFRHALLQEAIYEDLLPGERVRLHGVIARLLGQRDQVPGQEEAGDAAEQARHSLAAHDLPQALSSSLRAAVTADRRLAPAEALNQYEQVLQLWNSVPAGQRPPDTGLVTIGIAAADAAGNAGLRERAVALAESAVTAAGSEHDLVNEARTTLAIHLYAMDRMPELIDVARAVIESHPGADLTAAAAQPTPALVRTRGILARALFSVGEVDQAMDVVKPGLEEARQLGMRAQEADLEMTWSSVDGMLGRPGSDAHLQLARDAADASGDTSIRMRISYAGLIDRFEEGDLDGALGLIAENMALAERAGLSNSLYATQCRWILINTHWMLGDAGSAMAAVLDGCQNLPAFGSRQIQHAALPILAARAPTEALTWVHDLEMVRTNPWDAPQRWAALAEAHAWLGDLPRALECFDTAIEVLEALGEPYLLQGIAIGTNAVAVAADIAAAARSSGDAAETERVVTHGRRFVDDARERAVKGRPRRFRMGPEGVAWLLRLDAEEARLTGSDTVAQWQAAVEAFEFGAVYEQARCRWRLAQRLLSGGLRDDARAQVAQARESATSLGTAPLLAALDDLARRGRLGAGAAPSGDGHLTAREREVMRLVAEGLTNRAIGERLFISEKTASVHVSNVLTKLGASGRTEAVAIATREDLL